MRGLYAIIDVTFCEAHSVEPLVFAEQVLAAPVAILQLRDKRDEARRTLGLLRALRALCSERGVLLFANDRPDLAKVAGCDGVHVGQDDLPVAEIRRFAPELRIGVSTHDLEQLDAALAEGPDYVAFGPVFPTASKGRPDPVVGLDGLAQASRRARARGCPLVAIGGIDLSRAADVARFADLGAAIAALYPGSLDAVTDRVRALSEALS